MSAIYKTFTVESKVIDPTQGIYEAMVSTESVDRDGDILLADGAQLENYQKNPVVLFGHNYFQPEAVIAKATEIQKIPGKGIRLVFQFLKRGISPTADLVHDLWKEQYLNAMSVGFIPKETERRTDENGEELARGLFFKIWEFLEGSIVIIPSNQDALRMALGTKGYQSDEIDRFLDAVKQPDMEMMQEHVKGVIKDAKSVLEHCGEMMEMMKSFAPRAKRGRVLSATNEKRIREAVTSLQEVLASLGEEEPEQDSVEPPEVKTVIPYRDQGTADEGESWSAPGLSDFTDGTFADISDAEKRRIAAHYTWSANMPPENFGDLKLPHHRAAKSGVGPAVWRGVVAAMGALMGARQEVAIPDADMEGCHSHLAGHYRQFGREGDDIPELRAYSEEELLKLFPEVVDGAAESDAEPNTNDGHPADGLTHDASEAELEAVTDSLSVLLSTFREVIK